MDGQGRLLLPNGDEYVGGFRAGRRHGAGVYIDRTGAVYEGGFSAGLREGEGVVVPVAGEAYRSLWRGGYEVAGSRMPMPERSRPVARADYQTFDDVRLGIAADRRAVVGIENVRQVFYVSESNADGLRIFPDDRRLLEVWRGKAPIQALLAEMDMPLGNDGPLRQSFLGPADRFVPVPLLLDLENVSRQSIRIVGGYLDVSSSVSDLEPAMQLENLPLSTAECNVREATPDFDLRNYGWAPAESSILRLTFTDEVGRQVGRPIEIKLGTFQTGGNVDLKEDLRRSGIDFSNIWNRDWCADSDRQACLAQAKAAGILGEYADAIRLSDPFLLVSASGALEYDWHDADGLIHHKSSSFHTDIPLAEINSTAECGEGAGPEEIWGRPFSFKLDHSQYRIGLKITEDVPAGITARWRIWLDAPKSSIHDFRIVFQLADGREVASRPLNLLYFKPRSLADDEYSTSLYGASEVDGDDGAE
jgi:hypothetical protein